jgi:hypothetical protein
VIESVHAKVRLQSEAFETSYSLPRRLLTENVSIPRGRGSRQVDIGGVVAAVAVGKGSGSPPEPHPVRGRIIQRAMT